MPKITGANLANHKLQTDNFGYSAANIKDLLATEYTLVDVAIDVSSSVASFRDGLVTALKEIVGACQKSPRADNLMMRVVKFANKPEEVHGYRLLSTIDLAEYDQIQCGGNTSLFDAAKNSVESMIDYGQQLRAKDFMVNGVAFFITDGCNNNSKATVGEVKDSLAKAAKNESLESLASVLIAVNMVDPSVAQELDAFHKDAGISQFVELKDASAKTLAKLAKFVSQSISSTSQAVGTGGPSQPVVI